MKRTILFLCSMVCTLAVAEAQRTETQLTDWEFTRNGTTTHVTVPHDWAIAGPFDMNVDRQNVAIVQNGETEASEKSGRTGALPWVGRGEYRTEIEVEGEFKGSSSGSKGSKRASRYVLNFDGAMSEPEVYVNGEKAGEWKYGYSAFNVDITPYIKEGTNEIRVALNNRPESSRWYPGAGLYRPVTLIKTQQTAFADWGINCVTKNVENVGNVENGGNRRATLEITADVTGWEGRRLEVITDVRHSTLQTRIDNSRQQAKAEVKDGRVVVETMVDNPQLWSPEHPDLYTLTASLYEVKGKKRILLDEVKKKIGIRTVTINKEVGFCLNGETRKIKGVCLHHDLGMFGAAVNKGALTRQIMMLKSMGCDAIRTSHNMPSQMQMDLCDSLGMMVMAESFDMWKYPKCKNGYALFFDEWWERDLTNLVMANRLHPSIVMWSIGNEIPEQGSKDGARMCREMQDLMHRLDPSRLCTTGMDRWDACVKSGFAQTIDIPGLNYRTHYYHYAYDTLPQGFVLGSETASTVSSRGVYKFPVVQENGKQYPDGQCNGYDTEACWWSNLPDVDWALQDDYPWVIGEFVWTGFDYLGEPTPYDGNGMSRSSYFGIIDLAGLPKDRYYLYRSRWNREEHTIHLLPHWTWPGREGEVTPVFCYTDYPSAELFVNGKSQGRRTKDTTPSKPEDFKDTKNADMERYRLMWNEVKYEPGEIKVVVYDKDGNRAGEEVVRTAGEPMHTKTESVKYDDVTFVTVSIVDKDGNLCPDADNRIDVEIVDGEFLGICNGDATSLESMKQPTMKAFHGQLVFAYRGAGFVVRRGVQRELKGS